MKKSSVLFVLLLVMFVSGSSFAKLGLTVPAELSQKNDMFSFTANDNLSLSKNNFNGLRPAVPEFAPQADPAKMMLILSFALSLPTGDFGDAYNTGVGGNLTFAYSLYPYLILTGSIGYINWSGDEGIYDNFYEGEADFSVSSVPVLVGARYMFPTTSAFAPYVLGEIGLHFMSYDYESSFLGYNFDDSSTEFALGLGGGFMYPLSAALSLDVNGRYWIISDAGNFTFMAGVGYALGAM
jgi:opacity protein-like surface antigen